MTYYLTNEQAISFQENLTHIELSNKGNPHLTWFQRGQLLRRIAETVKFNLNPHSSPDTIVQVTQVTRNTDDRRLDDVEFAVTIIDRTRKGNDTHKRLTLQGIRDYHDEIQAGTPEVRLAA